MAANNLQIFDEIRRASPQSTLQRWHSAECRALSDPGGRTAPRGLTFDRVHGVYRPPQAGTEVPIVRRWTWEDDIALGRLRVQGCGGFATRAWSCESAGCKAASCSWDRQALLEPRGTHICRRRLLCSALGLPAAIGTVQRPAKGWTLRSDMPSPHALFILALEKNGLSTIDNLFQSLLRIRTRKRAPHPQLNMSRVSIDMWSASGRLDPYCSRSSNLQLLDAIAANSLRPMPAGSPWSERSGCGYAATFALDAASMAHLGQRSSDLPQPRLNPARRPGVEGAGSARPRVDREPILHIATVRDPLDRFVSAYNDHGVGGSGIARCRVTQKHIEAALREGRKPPPPCPPLALELRKHAQRLADGRFITRLTPHHAGIHFFSQSYFLSATDRDGAPLEWDMLVRLERLEQDLGPAIRAVLNLDRGGSSYGWRPPTFGHANSIATRHRGASSGAQDHGDRERLMAGLRNDSTTMCHICNIYLQDFVCLGYAVPAACLLPSCLRTLAPRLERAGLSTHILGRPP